MDTNQPPTNVIPSTNPASLQDTLKTQPAAVASSELATNVTNETLKSLAMKEAEMKQRQALAEQVRIKKEIDAAKSKAAEPSAVDKAILATSGVPTEAVVDPLKIQAENHLKNITSQIENLSTQVDPYTSKILGNIRDLYATELNDANAS